MAAVNRVFLIGNVGKDAELRHTATGKAVATFSLATTEKVGDSERTEWHSIVVWDRQAEIAQQYVKKGRQVYVEGRLQTRDWEKDGVKHYKTEVVCRNFQLLGRREDAPSAEDAADILGGELGPPLDMED